MAVPQDSIVVAKQLTAPRVIVATSQKLFAQEDRTKGFTQTLTSSLKVPQQITINMDALISS
jgi:hypothetical protein